MTNEPSYTCRACGVVLSASGGRCPKCGAEQPEVAQTGPSRAAIVGTPVRSHVPPKRDLTKVLMLPGGAALVLLGAAGFFVYWLALRAPPGDAGGGAASAAAPSATGPAFRVDAGAFHPNAVLVKAKVRALAWHPDAALVSAAFSPVVDGQVNVEQGGKFEVTYGKPAGRQLGPGAAVEGQHLAVIVDAAGTRTEEREADKKALVVAEPNCTFNQAWRALTASGVSKTARVSVRYERHEKHQRGVWSAEVEGEPEQLRLLDGSTCNLLRR